MTSPPISVVLPVYNAERFIGAALKSIVSQSWPEFEVHVIDDGSTDRSLAEVKRIIAGDGRFLISSRTNRGIVETLNEGIAAARGKYIFRMDADDVCHNDRFVRQLEYLESHSECVAVGTRMLLVDEDTLPIIEMIESFLHEEIDRENLRGVGSAMCHPSVAMRRDALLAIGMYRAEFEWAEDLDLFLRLAEVGRLANMPEVLLSYRQHMKSVGYAKRKLQLERTRAAVADALCRRGQAANSAAIDEVDSSSSDSSLGAIHRRWGWLALQGGFPKTARKHALAALKSEPLSPANPKLIACALRGY